MGIYLYIYIYICILGIIGIMQKKMETITFNRVYIGVSREYVNIACRDYIQIMLPYS